MLCRCCVVIVDDDEDDAEEVEGVAEYAFVQKARTSRSKSPFPCVGTLANIYYASYCYMIL